MTGTSKPFPGVFSFVSRLLQRFLFPEAFGMFPCRLACLVLFTLSFQIIVCHGCFFLSVSVQMNEKYPISAGSGLLNLIKKDWAGQKEGKRWFPDSRAKVTADYPSESGHPLWERCDKIAGVWSDREKVVSLCSNQKMPL